jgi:phenylpropionate dioxygenase-like ring-hydroxylating dioxygenase large terminal subunit
MLSLRAQLIELLGEEPRRPTVAEVAVRLRPGEVAAAQDGADEVAVVRLVDGRLCVVPDRCPHDGGRISDGWVEGDRIVCARHGWEVACDRPCLH